MAFSTFSVPNKIVHGDTALEYLATLEGKKASLVTGGSSMRRFGFLDEAKNYLEKADIEVQIIDGVEPDPSIDTCLNGGKKMLEFSPDWIIAIGGGSAMDAAKVMWIFYEYPDYPFEELVKFNFPKLRTKARFIGIPSTSGTASEVTAFSVITDRKASIKYPLASAEIIPDIAIVDTRIPAKMPDYITAQTGMDVLTHAIEAYVSKGANDYTDSLALQAIHLVLEHLQTAYREPTNMNARKKMHDASTIAGMAFSSAGLGIVHSMAHKIGGEFHVAHGEANAILLPYVISFNKQATNKYARLEGILGIDCLEYTVRNLNQTVGIPGDFQHETRPKIEESDFLKVLDRMSENALHDACTGTNPANVTTKDIKELYHKAYFSI